MALTRAVAVTRFVPRVPLGSDWEAAGAAGGGAGGAGVLSPAQPVTAKATPRKIVQAL